MSAIHLLAGSITVDQINASVGQELDIGSNRSLLLYSTVDGLRPAGSLQTQVSNGDGTFRPVNAGDSYISIGAQEGNKKAEIDIMTGGLLYMQGSEMDLRAQSTMNILGSTVNIKSLAPTTQGGETLPSTMNITSGGSLNISSTGEFLVDSTNFSIKKAGENNYNVEITGKVTADEGKIAGFTLKEVDKGKNTHRQFLQAGQTDSTTSSAAGVYIGTDGINIVGPSKNGAPISYLRFNTSDGASSMKIEADQIMLGTKSLQGNLNDINDTIADNAEIAKTNSDAAYAYADSKSQTFRCKSTEIVSKAYKVGDIWINTDTTTVNGQSVCFYHQYVCQKVSSTRNSTTDWVLAGTAVTSGAAIAIDTQNGTIDIISGNTIRAVAGQTVSIAANNELTLVSGTKAGQSNGVVKIGNGTRPFTIGSNASEAYIYNGKTKLSDTTTAGIYIGTDGIRIGKGKEGNNTAETQYFSATAGGNIDVSGTIRASALYIGGSNVISNNLIKLSAVAGTSDLATKDYVGSEITTLSNGIEARVWDELDQSSFTITSDKINIKSTGGLIVTTKNFTLDASGNVKTTGEINATSGKIGTWSIVTETNSAGTAYTKGYLTTKTTKTSPAAKSGSAYIDGTYIGTDGIGIGAGKFIVDSAGSMTATSGMIGSFTIDSALYTNGKKALNWFTNGNNTYYNPDGVYIGAYGISCGGAVDASKSIYRSKFSVTNTGVLYAQSATIQGTISGSTISGSTISGSSITCGSAFTVTSQGALTASSANISGTITADAKSSIGGWILQNGWFWKNRGDDCVCLSNVTSDGNRYAMWAGADWPQTASGSYADGTAYTFWAPFCVQLPYSNNDGYGNQSATHKHVVGYVYATDFCRRYWTHDYDSTTKTYSWNMHEKWLSTIL